MSTLTSYHLSWLSAHPHRSEDWLRKQLKDGFDVHHLDGNHSNDDPLNLVLMEHSDHLRLHKIYRGHGRMGTRHGKPKKKSLTVAAKELRPALEPQVLRGVELDRILWPKGYDTRLAEWAMFDLQTWRQGRATL